METNVIIHGDAIGQMQKLPNKSVDLVVIDPPYNDGKDIAWGNKWKTEDEYVDWLANVAFEIRRILKTNGSFYIFHKDFHLMSKLHLAIISMGYNFKNLITWSKMTKDRTKKGFWLKRLRMENHTQYYSTHEYIMFYTKHVDHHEELGKQTKQYMAEQWEKLKQITSAKIYADLDPIMGYNLTANTFSSNKKGWKFPSENVWTKYKEKYGIFQEDYNEMRNMYVQEKPVYNTIRYDFDDVHFRSTVWNISPTSGKYKKTHLTPKPLEIFENIIRTSSNEGDVVLDCFVGSGTTCVAAKKLNRQYIGIDWLEENVELTKKRLEEI